MRSLLLIAMMLVTPLTFAETDATQLINESTAIDADTATMTSSQAIERLSSSFSEFLGEQSATVVKGLRNGEEFTLTSSYTDSTGTQQTETITIEPPTSKMGYGNVNITLKLAENQLALSGITEPTAIQLESALLGGSITTPDGQVVDMQGVLTLRSEGMGWGQIAQQYDTRLGFIMGKKPVNAYAVNKPASSSASASKNKNSNLKATKIKTASVSASKGHHYGSGIVSASGSSIGAVGGHGNAFGAGKVHGASAASSVGRGIVSAGGSSVGHSNAGGNGKARGRGK